MATLERNPLLRGNWWWEPVECKVEIKSTRSKGESLFFLEFVGFEYFRDNLRFNPPVMIIVEQTRTRSVDYMEVGTRQ